MEDRPNLEDASREDEHGYTYDHHYEEIVSMKEVEELAQHLPKVTCNNVMIPLVNYQGFWIGSPLLPCVIAFQRHFRARDSNILITSMPKTGTTWLKALLFAVVNRSTSSTATIEARETLHLRSGSSLSQPPCLRNNIKNNLYMLTKKHPHELVYNLDTEIYGKSVNYPPPDQLVQFSSPRLFNTHLSYTVLPESIKTSGCRILYITRNPLDTFISMRHFYSNFIKTWMGEESLTKIPNINDYFDDCYQGRIVFGPFFEHVLEYWNQSLEKPNKVLFLEYEDLQDDHPVLQVKRIADFVGLPFSLLEEKDGVIDDIISMCSFDNLKGIDVNQIGEINRYFEKKSYFRKGKVGDWRNYFTPCMAQIEDEQTHARKTRGIRLTISTLRSGVVMFNLSLF